MKPNWYALRQPTLERIGQKVRYCLICDKIVERKDMTKKGYMYGLVARNFGPYVKDINYELATFKDRFTPLTFTQEGETVYPIVTDDGYYIGQLKLNVMSGTLTVAYQMNDPATYVDPTTEMLFLFPTAGDATAADLSAWRPHKFGEVIQLGGANLRRAGRAAAGQLRPEPCRQPPLPGQRHLFRRLYQQQRDPAGDDHSAAGAETAE